MTPQRYSDRDHPDVVNHGGENLDTEFSTHYPTPIPTTITTTSVVIVKVARHFGNPVHLHGYRHLSLHSSGQHQNQNQNQNQHPHQHERMAIRDEQSEMEEDSSVSDDAWRHLRNNNEYRASQNKPFVPAYLTKDTGSKDEKRRELDAACTQGTRNVEAMSTTTAAAAAAAGMSDLAKPTFIWEARLNARAAASSPASSSEYEQDHISPKFKLPELPEIGTPFRLVTAAVLGILVILWIMILLWNFPQRERVRMIKNKMFRLLHPRKRNRRRQEEEERDGSGEYISFQHLDNMACRNDDNNRVETLSTTAPRLRHLAAASTSTSPSSTSMGYVTSHDASPPSSGGRGGVGVMAGLGLTANGASSPRDRDSNSSDSSTRSSGGDGGISSTTAGADLRYRFSPPRNRNGNQSQSLNHMGRLSPPPPSSSQTQTQKRNHYNQSRHLLSFAADERSSTSSLPLRNFSNGLKTKSESLLTPPVQEDDNKSFASSFHSQSYANSTPAPSPNSGKGLGMEFGFGLGSSTSSSSSSSKNHNNSHDLGDEDEEVDIEAQTPSPSSSNRSRSCKKKDGEEVDDIEAQKSPMPSPSSSSSTHSINNSGQDRGQVFNYGRINASSSSSEHSDGRTRLRTEEGYGSTEATTHGYGYGHVGSWSDRIDDIYERAVDKVVRFADNDGGGGREERRRFLGVH